MGALRRFAFSRKDTFERHWCLQGLAAELEGTMCASDRCVSGPKTYVAEMHALFRALFASSDPTTRIVGAEAAAGFGDAADSRLMLDHALHDPVAAVRATMLASANIPRRYGTASAADRLLARHAIEAGLHDANADVNTAALAADLFVHRGNADRTLRSFAVSRDPLRRAAARRAINNSGFWTRYALPHDRGRLHRSGCACPLCGDGGLSLPDPRGRCTTHDHGAHAPTKAERAFARMQLQPEGL